MLSSTEINSIGHGIAVLIEIYAAYWAFGIRRALAVNIYRSQALGIGLVAVSFAILDFESVIRVFNIPLTQHYSFITLVILFIVFLVLFYWIDATMISARRSDPLLRDSLHWSKLRILPWIVIVAWVIIDILLFFFGNITAYETVGPLVLVPISGVIPLSIAARRSKDITFHRHLKWFAIFTVLLVIAVPLTIPNIPLVLDIAAFAFIYPAVYSLYRSAKSLAPLNKIQLEAN